MSKKFILVSPKNRTVYNFRGDLIAEIKRKGYEVIVTGPNTDNLEQIKTLGVRFYEIPMNKTGINIFSDIKYLLALRKLFKEERPDAMLRQLSHSPQGLPSTGCSQLTAFAKILAIVVFPVPRVPQNR